MININKKNTSLKAFKELNISITTKVVNAKVHGFYFPQVKYSQGSFAKS